MSREETFFEWEDSFKILENVTVDVYVNKNLKIPSLTLNKIEFNRGDSYLLNFSFHTQQRIYSDLIKNEDKTYNLEIELKLKEPKFTIYDSIIMFNTNSLCENYSFARDSVETKFTAFKVLYTSNREKDILKEWYGCNNKLNFYNGFSTSKITEETIKYKNQNNISYVIKNKSESFNRNSFWVKLKDFKFKVYIINSSNDKKEYKVVHGAKVDIQEMFIASEKAKELLTILTLKKLNYAGYIRNFVNNNELISIKDMSKINIESAEFK